MSSASFGQEARRLEERGGIKILSYAQSVEMREGFKRGACRGRGAKKRGIGPNRGNNGESLPLRSLLDSRRMRREHTGRVSKDAYEAGQVEVKWFHHGCITILVVSCLKRCLELSTECSHLSNVIPQRHLVNWVNIRTQILA